MKKLKKEKLDNPQFDLGLKDPRGNSLRNLRQKLYFKLRFLETKGYIRSPYPWFFIFLSVSLLVAQLLWINNMLPQLPKLIPIYLNQRDLSARLADKTHLYIFPIFSSIIILTTLTISTKFYYIIKSLSNYTFAVALIAVTMLTYGLLHIITKYYVG